jgi:hypothetical protein
MAVGESRDLIRGSKVAYYYNVPMTLGKLEEIIDRAKRDRLVGLYLSDSTTKDDLSIDSTHSYSQSTARNDQCRSSNYLDKSWHSS